MDYTTKPLLFKVRKAARYVALYGPERTLAKIRGQYHARRRYDVLPPVGPARPGRHVGLLGCGNFAFANIAHYLRRNYGDVLQGVMDVDLHRAASLYEQYDANYYTDDARRIVEDPAIEVVYVASNHASHAEYAIALLGRDKHVHIEKPHVVSRDQLVRLCRAMTSSRGRVALGFNRPDSAFGREIQRALWAQRGPAMFNWFIAGHEIPPDHWYFHQEEGGRVLGNLCHWTDFVYQLVPPADRFPLTIRPTRAGQSDCDIAVTFTFGDGTIAALTFSAKGHTFEGVRERFAAHRGDALISMDDFHELRIEVVQDRQVRRALHRDHGHERRVCRSYRLTGRGGPQEPGAEVGYVWETGELFLATRDALEQDREITLAGFTPRLLDEPAAATSAGAPG
jgi:predicted dehydrogenase